MQTNRTNETSRTTRTTETARTRRTATALTALTALTGLGVLAAPGAAVAESSSFADGKTTPGPMDIHRVSVVNEKRLQIRIKVDDLQKKAGRSASAWIDTDAGRKGPEFFIGSGLYDSDWQMSPADGWEVSGDPLSCPVDQRLRYQRDVISWTTGEACLGDYSGVRVSVETQKGDTVDHSPGAKEWHPWVARD